MIATIAVQYCSSRQAMKNEQRREGTIRHVASRTVRDAGIRLKNDENWVGFLAVSGIGDGIGPLQNTIDGYTIPSQVPKNASPLMPAPNTMAGAVFSLMFATRPYGMCHFLPPRWGLVERTTVDCEVVAQGSQSHDPQLPDGR
jgi:hypothetical protein